jgi:hypothetical protein
MAKRRKTDDDTAAPRRHSIDFSLGGILGCALAQFHHVIAGMTQNLDRIER